jgi:hypothetical protein
LESVELVVEVLDDVLPLGRGEFLLCHVGLNGVKGKEQGKGNGQWVMGVRAAIKGLGN